jgi:type IV secretory pathway TrbD component
MSQQLEGWRVPVNKAIQQPNLLLRLPRKLTVVMIVIGLVLVGILQQLWTGPIVVILWLTVGFLVKKDPDFFDVLGKHMTDPDYLEP